MGILRHINPMKCKSILLALILLILSGSIYCQNVLSVPFNNGFVGDNTANNVSSNSYYQSTLGWTNIQFAQNSSGSAFVSQGNDIVGMVIITDNNGVEHTINGYVKWRAPSGTVTSLVFSPTSSAVLATNGSNGSATFTINSTKYIGLIFNGQTLTIPSSGSNAGKVSGNAATTGLLSELNNYLTAFPTLTTTDYTVYESAGKVLVTLSLSASSSNTVSAYYQTGDSTAFLSSDYSAKTGSVSFAPGELTKTIEITLIIDPIAELTEYFKLTFSNPKNASITRGMSTITVLDDSPLAVELIYLNTACENDGVKLSWATMSEHNSDYFEVQKSTDGLNWLTVEHIQAQGESNSIVEYTYFDNNQERSSMYRILQVDYNADVAIFGPITSICVEKIKLAQISPNPVIGDFTVILNNDRDKQLVVLQFINTRGEIIKEQEEILNSGNTVLPIDASQLNPGCYFLRVSMNNHIEIQKFLVQ
jgi:hypothetical protein